MTRLLVCAAFVGLFAAHAYGSEAADTTNVFLITHSEVEISSDAAAIWPYILDTSEWKTLANSAPHSGEPDRVGEILRINGGSGDSSYQFYTETLELLPLKRKVIGIYFDDPAAGDISYAAWTLFENSNRTLVTYDVYSINRMPGIQAENIQTVREQITAPNQARFDKELRLLKALVEEQ